MANSLSHAALPYPIRNSRYTLPLSFRVAAGTPTDPTTPDTEVSSDGGATFAAAIEEITTGGANGLGYVTLTGAETNNNALLVAAKSANCLTTPAIIFPRVLALVGSGTLSAGSAGGGTLGTLLAYDVTGCFLRTTGGTGGGGTGGANNQARKIATYNTGTGAFTVVPDWETTPDGTTTYDVLLPEGVTLGMLRTLVPTTAGRTLDVSAGGEAGVDWANVGTPGSTVNLSATTVNTVANYTGNTPQTGDSFAIVSSATFGNSALQTILDTLENYAASLATSTISETGLVVDAAASTTSWITDLPSTEPDFYKDALVLFSTGVLSTAPGKVVSAYDGGTKRITVSEPFTSAPANGVAFAINRGHTHSTADIASAVRTELTTEMGRIDVAVSSRGTGIALDAAGIRSAVGLASANIDTQLVTIDDLVDGLEATIGVAGAGLTAVPWNPAWDAEAQSEVTDALTAALTEGYRAAGATGSVAQLLYEISAHLIRSAIAGTTKTIYKLDGTTPAKTGTLDDAVTPTSISEAT